MRFHTCRVVQLNHGSQTEWAAVMGPYLLRCVAGVELLACADCELDRRVQESRCDEKETELGRGHMKAKIVQSTPLKKKGPAKEEPQQ